MFYDLLTGVVGDQWRCRHNRLRVSQIISCDCGWTRSVSNQEFAWRRGHASTCIRGPRSVAFKRTAIYGGAKPRMARHWARSGAGPTNARFLEIGSHNWRRSQVAFERHFFGRSQLAPEPAPESAPRLNVPVKCGHDDDVNPVASNLFFSACNAIQIFKVFIGHFPLESHKCRRLSWKKKNLSETTRAIRKKIHSTRPRRREIVFTPVSHLIAAANRMWRIVTDRQNNNACTGYSCKFWDIR